MTPEQKRIVELETALAHYAQKYGMTEEARRLLVDEQWQQAGPVAD